MKNRLKVLGIVAAVAIIGLSVTACDTGSGNLVDNGDGFNIGDYFPFPIPEGNPAVSVTITGIPPQYRGMIGMLWVDCEDESILIDGIPRGLIAARTVFYLALLDMYYGEATTWLTSVPEETFDITLMMANPGGFDPEGDCSPGSILFFALAEGVNLSGNNTNIAFSGFTFSGTNQCYCYHCNCGTCD